MRVSKCTEVDQAYKCLADEERRREYDRTGLSFEPCDPAPEWRDASVERRRQEQQRDIDDMVASVLRDALRRHAADERQANAARVLWLGAACVVALCAVVLAFFFMDLQAGSADAVVAVYGCGHPLSCVSWWFPCT